jgi:hypothetical protein
MNRKVETQLLPPVGDPEHEKALKDILLDFDKRIGRLEKFVLVLIAIVAAVGGREYVITALTSMAK